MAAESLQTPRFIRKTQLAAGEYRKNFHQIDEEIIRAITSVEADRVTPLMSKVYLRLIHAPTRYREREGILRFEAEWREGKQVKAWSVLCEIVGVASATANKALGWMHEEGIIGYFSGKNGVGIRIFLNRAASSIGTRGAFGNRKILEFTPASPLECPASPNEAAFNDPFGYSENLDTDLIPHAPQNGANEKTIGRIISKSAPALDPPQPPPAIHERREVAPTAASHSVTVPVDEIVERLKRVLEPCVKAAAAQAATQATANEVAQTRKWFEERALPKAVRVAQHETYNLFKKFGTLDNKRERARADLQVGRATEIHEQQAAHPLTSMEITDTAEMCIALLETHGKAIDVTLSEISAEGGGWLLAEDAPRVRDAAQSLLSARENRR